jgi:hypothetical protein
MKTLKLDIVWRIVLTIMITLIAGYVANMIDGASTIVKADAALLQMNNSDTGFLLSRMVLSNPGITGLVDLFGYFVLLFAVWKKYITLQ